MTKKELKPNRVMINEPNPDLVGRFNIMDPDADLKPEDLEMLMEEVSKESEAQQQQATEDMFNRIGDYVAKKNKI